MRHDAQFDLRIVGGEKEFAGFGNECAAYLAPLVVANGNVLQIGVARTEPSGGGNRLVERGMYLSRAGIYQLGQGIDVGAEQLAQSAIFEYFIDDGVAVPQFFEHLFGGGVLSGFGLAGFLVDFQPLEKDFAYLSGRTDVERHSGKPVNLLLDFVDFAGQLFRRLPQGVGVNAHAAYLHFGEDAHQRHFNGVKEFFETFPFQFLLQFVFELQGDVGIFGGVGAHRFGGDLSHGELVFPFRAYQFVDVNGFVVEVYFGEVVHVVPLFGLQQVMGDHRVEKFPAGAYAVIAQHDVIVFDVLSDFQTCRILQGAFEYFNNLLGVLSFGRHGYVICFVFFHGERHSDQFDVHRLDSGRFRVECKKIAPLQFAG